MTKLGVLTLSFPHFTDISNVQIVDTMEGALALLYHSTFPSG
jgi:hypothetical protein